MRALPDDDAWLPELYRVVGDRLRAAREQQNLTQDDVWQAARVDRRTVQHAEQGRPMTLATVARIAWVLEVPLADLVRD
ncbi:helix-turn-helix transcriptional regulator [Streptomyces sp. NPDC021356]|uniref:helix-turn-helix domain-containing protein n=1 Tax=Streptomyces sp. NPDC021356 TaxID=3154900 RepID=UPI00340F6B76